MLGPDGPDEADQGVAGWEDAHYVGPPRAINRLRWHLHELDPSWEPPARCLWRPKHLNAILQRLDGAPALSPGSRVAFSNGAGCYRARSWSLTRNSTSSCGRWLPHCWIYAAAPP